MRSFNLPLLCTSLAFPLLSTASIFPITGSSPSTYALRNKFVGSEFLSAFSFETFSDPTHGRVNYVNESYALSKGLVSSTTDSFIMRADATSVLDKNGPGRDSIRIKSNEKYATHLAVFDIAHMPQGCGTWPAAWETDDTDWPKSGEVDIVEGVNDQKSNQMTLHTTEGCSMPSHRAMTGTALTNDCNHAANGNAGCSVSSNKASSFGPSFNSAGGGWYVIERRTDGMNVWFWSRGDPTVPESVKKSSTVTISSSGFGEPVATFPSTSSCDVDKHFGPNNIIFDLTFCGDWAGAVYPQSGCPGSCVDYVNNNPAAFKNAYWDVKAVRVYT